MGKHLERTLYIVVLVLAAVLLLAACDTGQPAAEQPAVDQPVVDEGAEQPAADQPAADQQPADESAEPVSDAHPGLIGSPDRTDQEYVWISQFSTLPLFVERVYPGLEAFIRDFGVTVRVAGPTTVDLAAYIATVEQECARGPAGVIVVGGWDPALTEPVNKCIEHASPSSCHRRRPVPVQSAILCGNRLVLAGRSDG